MIEQYGGVYIPNLANDGAKYGIGQYRFARNFELAGKDFTIEAEGKSYSLSLPGCCGGEAAFNGKKCDWECVKLASELFFVRFGQSCAALDLANGLATLVLYNRKTPLCGAIQGMAQQGAHGPAGSDMVGTKVRWIFGVNRYVNHEHISKGKVRSAWAKDTVRAGWGRTFRDNWEAPAEDYVTEDLRAVKLGGPYYLVDIAAQIPEGVNAPAGVKRLVLLEDYDHMMTVGCAFGPDMAPILLSGYAKFL